MSGSSFILLGLLVLAVEPTQPTRRAPAESPLVGRTVAILKGAVDNPMGLPTSVAVAPSGHVFVADGVNDRVVEFDGDGQLHDAYSTIGAEHFSRPLSVKVDGQGNLWIADTGNERVLVRSPGGQLVRTITVPGPVDLTDLALPNAKTVWLIDNEHHRLIRHDLVAGTFENYGQLGQARGQFHYPFMAATDATGMLYVSDSINGRVQAIRDVKILPREFASYGVEPGQFHRPKGIAVDSDGRVIVVDGSLGVVQYFESDGTFLDALRDETGAVMRFDSPCGVATNGSTLYVTEMMPGEVRKLTIETRKVKPDFTPPRKLQQQHPQPTVCTACHLEWMPHFGANTATGLSAPPASRPQEPYVSSAASCLSCHDGSVVDSRRKVWRDHGHLTGVAPPAGMNVPKELPLVDGKLACRTCHSAHTHGGAGQGMADSIFLRVSGDADELCIRCHTGYEGKADTGTHVTTGFNRPIHPALVSAGAKYSFDGTSTGCLVCHVGHGSRRDRLLISMPATQQMCVACHSEISLAPTGAGHHRLHPLGVALSPQQKIGLKKLGAESGQSGTLECISCHRVHHAPEASKLLVKTQRDSALCMECHSSYRDVLNSSHDLRQTNNVEHPLPVDCNVSGPCASCHGVHSLPFTPLVSRLDQEGACIACHQADGCAALRTGQPFLHPVDISTDQLDRLGAFTARASKRAGSNSLTCLSCHDPHLQAEKSPMLRGAAAEKPAELCFECHAETRPIQYSFHSSDHLGGTSSKSECDSCHAIHAPSETWQGDTWITLVGTIPPLSANQHCTGCHSAAGGQDDIAFTEHPPVGMTNVVPVSDPGFMPLVDSVGNAGSQGKLGCITCHLPHGRAAGGGFTPLDWASTPQPLIHASKPMLRPYVGPNLCSGCHGSDGLGHFLYFHQRGRATTTRAQPPFQR